MLRLLNSIKVAIPNRLLSNRTKLPNIASVVWSKAEQKSQENRYWLQFGFDMSAPRATSDWQNIHSTPVEAKRQSNTSTRSTTSSRADDRRGSSSSNQSSPPQSQTSKCLQVIPHTRNVSLDAPFSSADLDLLKRLSFSDQDLSSRDFAFDDVFTYDKPQKRLPKVAEVTVSTRERDWSSFTFPHYSAAVAQRAKVNRSKSSASEKYVKNKVLQTQR